MADVELTDVVCPETRVTEDVVEFEEVVEVVDDVEVLSVVELLDVVEVLDVLEELEEVFVEVPGTVVVE